jgi:hypothetical protein
MQSLLHRNVTGSYIKDPYQRSMHLLHQVFLILTSASASRAHRFVTVHTCANCGWTRRIPSPPQPIEDAMRVESSIEDDTPKHRKRLATELSQRELRKVRPPPLFKRTGHIIQTPNKVQIVGESYEEPPIADVPSSAEP